MNKKMTIPCNFTGHLDARGRKKIMNKKMKKIEEISRRRELSGE